MSEFTLTEAINSARQMANFFKSFKKIEEVVGVAAMLEQNIKELELRKAKLIPEIESLIEKKNVLEESFLEVSEKIKDHLREEKSAMDSELSIAREKFEGEKNSLLLEIEAINIAKMNTLADHADAMDKIKSEKDLAENSLASIKGELEKIKSRLN